MKDIETKQGKLDRELVYLLNKAKYYVPKPKVNETGTNHVLFVWTPRATVIRVSLAARFAFVVNVTVWAQSRGRAESSKGSSHGGEWYGDESASALNYWVMRSVLEQNSLHS